MKRGSFKAMKNLNKSLILTKILNDGPISRAEIAKEIKLTPPTVGTIVKELIEQGIVKESAQGESKGGRKPTLLVIDYDAFYMIGIDAGPSEVAVILTNLAGEEIDTEMTPLPATIAEQQFVRLLIEQVTAVLSRNQSYANRVIGIGVAMHGVVDAEQGIALYAPNLNLRDMPIVERLSDHFQLPVRIENDARALALSETWFGQGKASDKLLAVNIGSGVGAGVVLHGELYRGDSHIAGEIGHMTIDLNGDICSCGNKGCLQTVISGPAIQARATRLLASGVATSLNGTTPTAKTIFAHAEEGDRFSREVLHDTAVYIGIGLTNVIHTLNPDRIILHGGVMKASKYLLPVIKDTIEDRALTQTAKETEVLVSDLGDYATALGAVALILVELFKRNGEIHV